MSPNRNPVSNSERAMPLSIRLVRARCRAREAATSGKEPSNSGGNNVCLYAGEQACSASDATVVAEKSAIAV